MKIKRERFGKAVRLHKSRIEKRRDNYLRDSFPVLYSLRLVAVIVQRNDYFPAIVRVHDSHLVGGRKSSFGRQPAPCENQPRIALGDFHRQLGADENGAVRGNLRPAVHAGVQIGARSKLADAGWQLGFGIQLFDLDRYHFFSFS